MKRCKEIKTKYFGEEVVAECFLAHLHDGEGVLKYYFDRTWNVNGLQLEAPMYTLAYYSEKKPYNVYCWLSPENEVIAYYFNIVRGTTLTTHVFSYADLIVDVLVYPDQSFVTLDEDELPEDMDEVTYALIYQVRNEIIDNLPNILIEVNGFIVPHFDEPSK